MDPTASGSRPAELAWRDCGNRVGGGAIRDLDELKAPATILLNSACATTIQIVERSKRAEMKFWSAVCRHLRRCEQDGRAQSRNVRRDQKHVSVRPPAGWAGRRQINVTPDL
jgi:hypothetical protein